MLKVNKAISFGRLYFLLAWQAQGAPLCDKAKTFEKEGKERSGDGILLRLPFCDHRPTKGLVVGLWRKNESNRKRVQQLSNISNSEGCARDSSD